jgi:hypothetical protein
MVFNLKSSPFMPLRLYLLLYCLVLVCAGGNAQYPAFHHYSTESDIGHQPCYDTLHVFSYKRGYEIGVILPSWQDIIGEDYVAIGEGTIKYNPNDGSDCSHVSHEDLPFYHYTHDMCFDIIPDATPDGRYTNLLPYLVNIHPDGSRDTTLQSSLGIEWECGIAGGNKMNPCAKLNNEGKSCGGCTGGHGRGDIIWQWPTYGDWIHVEGLYVWDRGHPPANAEIHPARLMAIRRFLPGKIKTPDSTYKYATRMDIYANGDGGAMNNERTDAKPYIRHTQMSSKDYEFSYQVNLTKPSPSAILKVIVEKHKGDTYPMDEKITVGASGGITVKILWQSMKIPDDVVYGRTIYASWNEGSGTSDTIDEYKIDLTKLYLKKLSEMGDKAEMRLFANVGSDWIFLNDFFPKGGKILSRGLGETFKKRWTLTNNFTVYVPRGKAFRVFMSGWEADGVDFLMGDIMDPASLCDATTKRFFKKRFFNIRNMLLRGCEDDEMGEMSAAHRYPVGIIPTTFQLSPAAGMSSDPCPFSKYTLKDRYFITYNVSLVK